MMRLIREPGAPGPPVGAPDQLVGARAPAMIAQGDLMQRPVMGASGVTSTAAHNTARSYADDSSQPQSAEQQQPANTPGGRPQRVREPSSKALNNIATFNIDDEQIEDEQAENDPKTLQEALASKDRKLWEEALRKELQSLENHKTLQPVKLEKGMRVFKAKLIFKTKADGTKKIRAVVQAFKRMFEQGIDYEEKYAGTTRWNTIMLVLVLAVFYGYEIYLIDIKTLFLHGFLSLKEQIIMTRIEGQDLPEGYVNKVVGSLYGHPAAAYRAKQELHKVLTRDGLFKQTASDPNLYVLCRPPHVCWLPVHVDDMPVTGTPEGVAMAIERLREAFEITVEVAPKRILGVQVERNWKTKQLKIHQGPYTRKLLKAYQAEDCILEEHHWRPACSEESSSYKKKEN